MSGSSLAGVALILALLSRGVTGDATPGDGGPADAPGDNALQESATPEPAPGGREEPPLAGPPENPYLLPEDLEPEPLASLPFELHGRLDLTYARFESERNVDGFEKEFFNTLSPALGVRWPLGRRLTLLGEVELDGQDGKLELDQLLLELAIPEVSARIGAGIAYVPFGIERFHYSPATNPLVDRPSPFRRIFPGSYSDLGVFLAAEWVDQSTGRGLVPELALTRGLRGPDRDDRPDDQLEANDELQVVGRLGLRLMPGLELGASGLVVWIDEGNVHRRLDLVGVDLRWQGDFTRLRAELIGGTVERSRGLGGDYQRNGWYVELYRRLPLDRPWLEAIELVARVDSIDDDTQQRTFLDVERYALGVNWVPDHHTRLKFEFIHSDERGNEIANDGFFVQWEMHF